MFGTPAWWDSVWQPNIRNQRTTTVNQYSPIDARKAIPGILLRLAIEPLKRLGSDKPEVKETGPGHDAKHEPFRLSVRILMFRRATDSL
jgi:hypothetical protein